VCISSTKEQDVAAAADLLQNVADALFKLAPVLGAREHARHIERKQPPAPQDLRHPARGQPLRQALDDGRLADARLADERGVILVLAAEDLHDHVDLLLAPDHGLGARGLLQHVVAVQFQQFRGGFPPDRLRGPAALQAQIGVRKDAVEVGARALQHAGRGAALLARDGEQQMLRPHGRRAQPPRLLAGAGDDLLRPGREPLHERQPPRAAPAVGQQQGAEAPLPPAEPAQHAARGQAALVQHREHQMLRADVAVAELPRLAAGAAQDARQLRGKYLIFHRAHLFLWDFRPRRAGLYRRPEI
jgi:hypothetical protein